MAYYIAEGAVVKGQVTMADGASVWYNATVRGDSEPIEIGRNSNIQDNAVVHVDLSHSVIIGCLLYTSPSPRDGLLSRMPSSA